MAGNKGGAGAGTGRVSVYWGWIVVDATHYEGKVVEAGGLRSIVGESSRLPVAEKPARGRDI